VFSLGNWRAGRWYTVVTSTFMHHGVIHLVDDLWDLWFYGIPIIILFGLSHFAGIYILGGISGGLLRLHFDWLVESEFERLIGGKEWWVQRTAVGAADPVRALMMVLALTVPMYKVPFITFPLAHFISGGTVAWCFLYTLGGLLSFWAVDVPHHGHFGGYVFGACVLGVFLKLALPLL